ncbi:26S proteasome non-ATPase regulatory subunit 7-like [Zophobas morio]|uniref:26S proteasome non-ATPase regulatory subunit 7-like n=1 Tax=Zophobas morio TaxID=2755281 RepID=UPI003083499D
MPSVLSSKTILPDKVVVHPLVLLSVVDHYNRVSGNKSKARVVGALLGSVKNNVLDVSNSFAVPFEEDRTNPKVWFVDHNYVENMYYMFRKINAREKLVGWYHTGSSLRQNDLEINELFKRFMSNPLLCTIDVQPKEEGLPTSAYMAVEEINDDGSPTMKTFAHISSEIGAEEAEEIGVEHLLRDIKDTMTGTLSQKVSTQLIAIEGLARSLKEMHQYLCDVVSGNITLNNQILYQMQNIINLLPNLNVEETLHSLTIKSNDELLAIYIASLVRSVIALHDLINNKIAVREVEKDELPIKLKKIQKKDENEEKTKKDVAKDLKTTTFEIEENSKKF